MKLFDKLFSGFKKKTFYVILCGNRTVYNKKTCSFESMGRNYSPNHLFDSDSEVCTIANELQNRKTSSGNYFFRTIEVVTISK